jgi:hypothetical protein
MNAPDTTTPWVIESDKTWTQAAKVAHIICNLGYDQTWSAPNWTRHDRLDQKGNANAETCEVPAHTNASEWIWDGQHERSHASLLRKTLKVKVHASDETDTRFDTLAQSWHDETRFHSSLHKKYLHPSYQAIIGMGRQGIPFVLRALRDRPDRWFHALIFMNGGVDVAKDANDFESAREIWLKWGQDQHIL